MNKSTRPPISQPKFQNISPIFNLYSAIITKNQLRSTTSRQLSLILHQFLRHITTRIPSNLNKNKPTNKIIKNATNNADYYKISHYISTY